MGVSDKLNCMLILRIPILVKCRCKLNIKRGVEESKITGISLSNKLISVFFLRTFFFIEIR